MSWLATLDAKARAWPLAVRWPYRTLKWLLIILGVYLALGLAATELSEQRVGLGLGISVAMVFAIIKGVVLALQRSPRPPDASE